MARFTVAKLRRFHCGFILQLVALLWPLVVLLARRPQRIVADVRVDVRLWPMLATFYRWPQSKKS